MQEKVKKREKERETRVIVNGRRWAELLRQALVEALWVGCAFLLGHIQMLFGTYPLGLALLCASSAHTVAIFIGVLLSSVMVGVTPVIYICAYAIAAVVRIVSAVLLDPGDTRGRLSASLRRRMGLDGEDGGQAVEESQSASASGGRLIVLRHMISGLFSEHVRLRMTTGAVCALIIALYRVIVGGFQYYDLFASIFVVLVTPAAVMAYSVAVGSRDQHPILKKISWGILLFSAVWAGNEVRGIALSISAVLAFFLTLYVCRKEGTVWGCVAGIACGVAYDPLYAPAFLLAALSYSFLHGLKRENAGILISVVAALFWSVYVGGAWMLLILLPAMLLGATLFTLSVRFSQTEEDEEATEDDERMRLRVEGIRHQDSNDRFRGISDAFSSLSEMFYNLSDRFRRPGTLDLRRICDSSFDAFCPSCPNKSVCWGLEYSSTLSTVNNLISALHTRGKVTRAQIPEVLTHRCERVDEILTQINRECAKLTGELLRNNRTEIFAMDYESAAKIINDALEEDDGEYRFDSEQEQRIFEYLSDAGVRVHSVTVYGKRRRQILARGVDVEQARVTVETLRTDLGEMCGMALSSPSFEVDGGVTTMSLQARKKISVSGAKNNVSSDGGVSGDTVNLFSNKKDYFYALISDGMGAGKEAALTSGLCSTFLERMLRAGNRAGTSLRMLNNMIRSRGVDSTRECSSTVDLLELDLMTAEAAFIKSGAAPSFVVRGRVVHRLQAGSAPIGIIGTLDAQTTEFTLREGDTVVMISDGVLLNDPECAWLTSYLCGVGGASPEEIVYQICLHAAQGETHDDCSAVALRITAAEEA